MLAVRRQEHVMRSARDRAIRSCSMQEYAEIFREKDLSMQEYARVCKSMQEYARVCKGMQRVCKSMQEYARVCKSMQRVCKEYARIFRARVLSVHGAW